MCNFMSGIIRRNEIVLAPMYNQSHSALIRKLNIHDGNRLEASFVKVELLPYEDNLLSDISKWRYVVDQDITPDWYNKDAEKYEHDFREKAAIWMQKNIINICGQPCTKLKEENGLTYFHVCNSLFYSSFGKDNDYRHSKIRGALKESDFAKALKDAYGDALVPVRVDLTSLDGLKDYGDLNEDVLSLMDIDLYRECRPNIFKGDSWWWLATPDSTNSGYSASYVRYVCSGGDLSFVGCGYDGHGVRPFFILKSSIFES